MFRRPAVLSAYEDVPTGSVAIVMNGPLFSERIITHETGRCGGTHVRRTARSYVVVDLRSLGAFGSGEPWNTPFGYVLGRPGLFAPAGIVISLPPVNALL